MEAKKSKLYNFMSALGSFVVGVGALFIIKLALMIPLNLVTNERNLALMQGVGALLFLFAIYLAIKWTKRINAIAEVKRRRIHKATILVVGFFCMAISNIPLGI